MTRTIMILLMLLSGVVAAVHAQLPTFHFVGAPASPHQFDATILLNDRLMCGHHLYNNATASWRELPQLREFYRTARGVEFPNTLLFTSPYVLNDSLIGFDSAFSVSQPQTFHIWNLNTDELVHTGTLPRLESRDYQRYYFLDADNDVVFYVLDTAAKSLTLTSYALGSTTGTTRSFPFTADVEIIRILARSEGGYWIVGKNTVLFTQDFSTVQDVSPVGRQPGRADLSRDGSTLHVISIDTLTDEHYFSTRSTPDGSWTHVPVPPSVATTFQSSQVDERGVLWSYEHQVDAAPYGRDDGFIAYNGGSTAPMSQFPHRARVMQFAHSSSGWIAVNTLTGLLASTDIGTTWQQLKAPMPDRTVTGTIAISRDGTVALMERGGPCYQLSADQRSFTVIPGEYFPYESDYRFPIAPRREPSVYDHDADNIVCMFDQRWYLGDRRGLAGMAPGSIGAAEGVWWDDTLYMSGYWSPTQKDPVWYTRPWVPGDLRDTFEFRRELWDLTAPIGLSNGVVFYGGRVNRLAYSSTGYLEDIQYLNGSYHSCLDEGKVIYTAELNDSLYVVIQDHGICTVLMKGSINNINALRSVGNLRLETHYLALIRGHAGTTLQIVHPEDPNGYDSVDIWEPDFTRSTHYAFVGVEEKRVIDLAFDPRNDVYYLTTSRGLYRSDRVTSVAADVQRPWSDVPHQNTWYNTLGEHIEPPTRPGLYFKIMIDVTGSMTTEKVVIR